MIIGNLEIHVAHACNLSCESCSHYSNHGHKGFTALDDAEEWMSFWSHRIEPKQFSLLGGEPTLHPQLPEFIELTRKYWPHSHLRIVTNGFFLHRHRRLPEVLRDDPDIGLYVSMHHQSPLYIEKFRPIKALINLWIRKYDINVMEYQSFQSWTRRYHGYGSAMEPFEDKQPRQSWENCVARNCPQLYEGKIWKCGPLAYLKLQNEKFNLSNKWQSYLKYKPLEPSCDDQELDEFFNREEESACNMCSAKPEKLELPMPIRGLTTLE